MKTEQFDTIVQWAENLNVLIIGELILDHNIVCVQQSNYSIGPAFSDYEIINQDLYCASSNFRNYINGNTHNNYNYSFTAQIKQLLDSSWENLSKLSLRNIIGHMPKEL